MTIDDRMTETEPAGRRLHRLGLLALGAAATVTGFLLASRLKHVLTTGELIIPGEIVAVVVYAPILLITAGAWLIARRTGSPIARGLAAVGAAFLAGSLGAAILAPSYVPPGSYPGTLEVRIDSPVARVARGPADCRSTPDGTALALASASLNGLGPYEVEVSASKFGGLSQDGPARRDGLDLIIAERPAVGEVAVADGPLSEFVADESSLLSISTEGAGGHKGSLTFANLRQTKGTGAFGASHPLILSGAVSWSCDMPMPQ